jgi:hypothetical protein
MQFCHLQFDAKIIWHIFYSCNPFANYYVLTGHCVANVCACVHCCAIVHNYSWIEV